MQNKGIRVGFRRVIESLTAFGLVCAAAAAPWHGITAEASATVPIDAHSRSAPTEIVQDPLPLDAEALAWVEATLANLSLRDRAAQVVVPWISGASLAENRLETQRMLRWVREERVGGLIVSTGRPAALATKLNAAQEAADVPLLIVSDLETGPAMRLRPGGTDVPPAMALGAADSEELARAAGALTGVEARAVGIHMTLGPVLDVNSNPANPIINVRSFGGDPERVARIAAAWIEGARSAGLQTAGKHFPGHGDTEVDSHLGVATISGDSARLASVELPPFQQAIRAGMDGVLVGHIAVPAIDGPEAGPATLSPHIVTDLLRGRMDFDGLIVTDALNMGAITERYPVAEASLLALLAGADLLLQPPGTESVIEAIVQAVQGGRLPQEHLDRAVRRVLLAKARAGLHHGARVDAAAVESVVGSPSYRRVAERIATASITEVRDRDDLIPLPEGGSSVLHLTYTDSGRGLAMNTLNAVLREAGHPINHVPVGGSATRGELDAIRRQAETADIVLASVLIAPHQHRALGMRGGFPPLLEEMAAAGKPVVVISLGSPYLLDAFPSVSTYLLAWTASAASQRAVADVLLGRTPATGRLPIQLTP